MKVDEVKMQEHCLGHLLIVDDELELTNALCEMLNKHGYLAAGFTSGQAALKALAESEFDILLTDMMMPEMDGIALMRAALRVDQNLVAFMMTGQGTVQTAVEAMKVGAFDYVLKPFKMSALLPVLDRAMEVRRLRMENVQLHETVSIYELTTTIAYSLDLNTIMNKTVEAAREQLNADEVSLMRSTRLGDELYVAAVCGKGREKILGERVRLEQGIAGWVARYRESVKLYGDVNDDRFAPLFPRSDIGPALSMPMLVGNKLVGVLNVNVKERRPAFTLGQVKGLMILASVAASALESASLYAQVHEAEARYHSIFANAINGIFQTTPDGRFTLANPALARMLGFSSPEELISSVSDVATQVFVDPTRRTEVHRLLQESGKVEGFEFEALTKAGGRIWISENVLVVKAENGEVLYYEGTTENITARKRTEEELRFSNTILSTTQETLMDGLLVVDENARIITYNHHFIEMMGVPPELAEKKIDQPVLDFVVSQVMDPQKFLERVRYLYGHKTETSQDEIILKNGKILERYSAPMNGADGRYYGRVWYFHDVTERKQAVETLRLSEEKYRSLVNEVNDGFYISDESGVFTFANPAMARIYGFEAPQEIIGRKFMDFIVPEALAELSHSARSTMHSTQAPEVINGQIVRSDGTRAFIEIKAVSILQDGQIVGSQGVVRDVTERKRAEEKLEEERILLRTLIDNLPDQIYIMDVQGRKIIANIADWQASGRNSMEEVLGKTDLELYPPELGNAYWALDKSVIDSGTALINLEEPGQDTRGEPLWLLSSKVPIRDARGKVVGLVGIGRNITERKEKEEEIRLRSAELEALYKLSRRLAEADDLAAVIQQVIQNAVESIHTSFAGLLLLEEADLVPYAVYPVNVLGQDFILGKRQPVNVLPICQSVLEKNEPVTLHAEVSEVGSAERQVLLLDFAQSVCLVPLRLGDAGQGRGIALGLLILGETRTDSREPFTPGKLSLACSIGDQAAAAIRRMLLREQAGRRLQQLASLSEIDRTIASIMDLRISLQMILRHVCERLEVDAAGVLVFNETLQSLEYAAGRGLRSQDILGTRQRLGEGQAGKAALERQMVQIPDISASRAVFGRQNFNKVEKVAAYFAVPLINKGKLKGVLEVYQRSPLYPNEEWLDFLNTLAGQAAIAIDNVQMFEHLQRSTDELELAYDATIEGWSHALDLRDKETEGHTRRVTELTVKLARRFGISEKDLVQVRWGALLHDIGKMGVPDGILLKPGPLTDEEWVVMKKHPGLAYDMLKPIGYLRQALDIPYCHHEKWDGSGYPRGLQGERIPLVARIFAVVDVWDALTSDRPYRLAWSHEKARQHIQEGVGTHFDPRVVEKFFQELDLN